MLRNEVGASDHPERDLHRIENAQYDAISYTVAAFELNVLWMCRSVPAEISHYKKHSDQKIVDDVQPILVHGEPFGEAHQNICKYGVDYCKCSCEIQSLLYSAVYRNMNSGKVNITRRNISQEVHKHCDKEGEKEHF